MFLVLVVMWLFVPSILYPFQSFQQILINHLYSPFTMLATVLSISTEEKFKVGRKYTCSGWGISKLAVVYEISLCRYCVADKSSEII